MFWAGKYREGSVRAVDPTCLLWCITCHQARYHLTHFFQCVSIVSRCYNEFLLYLHEFMHVVLDRFTTVVITSGTLSPLTLHPRLLAFHPLVSRSLAMSTFRPCLLPLLVTRGADQTNLSTKFETRGDEAIARNYGLLLVSHIYFDLDWTRLVDLESYFRSTSARLFLTAYAAFSRLTCTWRKSFRLSQISLASIKLRRLIRLFIL